MFIKVHNEMHGYVSLNLNIKTWEFELVYENKEIDNNKSIVKTEVGKNADAMYESCSKELTKTKVKK